MFTWVCSANVCVRNWKYLRWCLYCTFQPWIVLSKYLLAQYKDPTELSCAVTSYVHIFRWNSCNISRNPTDGTWLVLRCGSKFSVDFVLCYRCLFKKFGAFGTRNTAAIIIISRSGYGTWFVEISSMLKTLAGNYSSLTQCWVLYSAFITCFCHSFMRQALSSAGVVLRHWRIADVRLQQWIHWQWWAGLRR